MQQHYATHSSEHVDRYIHTDIFSFFLGYVHRVIHTYMHTPHMHILSVLSCHTADILTDKYSPYQSQDTYIDCNFLHNSTQENIFSLPPSSSQVSVF